MSQKDFYKESMIYHRKRPYGKISIQATKPLADPYDLSLAYTPGVAEPCLAIQTDPEESFELTSRANLIAVISNGTAVLGLGAIGALASKPVMEGKAVLFKKFANIDAFDLEVDELDPDKLIHIIASLEPTFGGINLEDIKAPECFYIEQELRKRLKIPVFHDDQHGTAIIASAGILNALELQGKKIDEVKLICSGAGAGGIACLNLLVELGVRKENIFLFDSKGLIIQDGTPHNAYKARYAQSCAKMTLEEALTGADIFLGLSAPNIVTESMLKKMADRPIIFALANPDPEVSPILVKSVRSDAIIATGRSDYPNQVNNVLCYPYIFRGALDVGASEINEEMKKACVYAISRIAKAKTSEHIQNIYGGDPLIFGPDYIIPKPFDKRLFVDVSLAVAKAAMETGVAKRPRDIKAYHDELMDFLD